jgi:hypothetical protein
MVNKIDEALRRKLKDEFVHGYLDEDGVRRYPTISALSKRHDVANISLHRWSNKENWQEEKNRVQTEYELAVERERMETMVKHGKNLDDRSINLAMGMLSDAARRMTEDQDTRRQLQNLYELPRDTGEKAQQREKLLDDFFEQNKQKKILSPHDMRSIAGIVSEAQKIGKLALGQAQEISKVSAHVSAPESLREIIADLDELAAAKSSTAKHTIQ